MIETLKARVTLSSPIVAESIRAIVGPIVLYLQEKMRLANCIAVCMIGLDLDNTQTTADKQNTARVSRGCVAK